MFKGIRLIIYDLDGVLVDSNKAILESFKRTMMEINEPYKPEKIMSRIGFSLPQIFKDTLPAKYHTRLEELRQMYIKHFQSLDVKYTKLLPNVAETLFETQDRGFLQSVATNKTVTEAERILGELGVLKFFDLLAGFMTVDKPKPEPDMIFYILDKLQVEPFEAVLVDDTNVGLTAGIKAGVRTIGITTGNNTVEQIQLVNPTTIIHSFSEILKIIER
ncbi:MAG: HAD family hydrolase [Promethearchaeota archaeon]|jgi:HAD superfamily hydrolase (TIGR01509 family)